MNDEVILREALHDLTLDQPAAPVDRVVGVRRHHVRRRTTQLAALAGVVALVAVAAAFVRTPFGNDTEPAHRSVPSWALPWPDHRDGSVSQDVLDGAVLAWRYMHITSPEQPAAAQPKKIVWYVGQKVAHGEWVAVVFEVDTGAGYRLVAGLTTPDAAAHPPVVRGQQLPPAWHLYDVPAPAPNYHGFVGLNFGASSSTGPFTDWIVVLAPPSARQVSWSGDGIKGGAAAPDRGLVVADVGRASGRIYADVFDRTDQIGIVPSLAPVGVPGAPDSQIPQLVAPARLVGTPSTKLMGGLSGQGSSSATGLSHHPSGPTTIYARCYGDGPIRVSIDGHGTDAVVIPCDNRQHVLPGPQSGHSIEVAASKGTAWRVAVFVGR